MLVMPVVPAAFPFPSDVSRLSVYYESVMKRLRFKAYLVVIPVLVATSSVGGYVAFQESRAGMTRLASRHMAYKAEQLRDFINSEWAVVESLGLSDDPAYREAQEASFRSYAYSLLRSDTEEVSAFDDWGGIFFTVGGRATADGATRHRPPAADGWYTYDEPDGARVGIAFAFEPFEWVVTLSERSDYFFSSEKSLLRNFAVILAVAIVVASLLSASYLGRVTGPLERLTDAVSAIASTGDASIRVPVEYDDEIGELAGRFNETLEALEDKSRRLAEAVEAERLAHATTVEREHETLKLLARIADYNDEQTGAHVERIGELSAYLARLLGLDAAAVALIRDSAPLHDIGKIGVSDAVLLKPGPLSPQERVAMQRHAVIGRDILSACRSEYLADGAVIAMTHHEKWDGSGYPGGLAGEGIPLSGRIVAVADVFDALLSDRPYKPGWTLEAARAYVAEQGGGHFDPRISALFDERFDELAEFWLGLKSRERR